MKYYFFLRRLLAVGSVFFLVFVSLLAEARDLRLATTTRTENSGLLRAILPQFETRQGFRVEVVSVGTGKALKLGENGDV